MAEPYRVLFVCTGNICRSPMAEGLLREILPNRLQAKVTVSSSGTHARDGQKAEPQAIIAAQEIGVDIRGHRARAAGPDIIEQSDLILVMEKLHAIAIKSMMPAKEGRVRLVGEYNPTGSVLEIPDPYGGDMLQYRKSLTLIQECLVSVAGFLDMMLD